MTVNRIVARFFAAVLFCLAASFAGAQSVVETHYDDGALKERFEVDADGHRHGAYEAFREDGTRAATAVYRADRLHGKSVEFDSMERPRIEAMYANGQRVGFWREYEAGVLRLAATYQRDVLDGSWDPRPSTEIRAPVIACSRSLGCARTARSADCPGVTSSSIPHGTTCTATGPLSAGVTGSD